MNNTERHSKLVVCIILVIFFIAFPLTAYSKDKIRIGNAIALSGGYAFGAKTTQIAPYDMWVKEVNAKGGIFLREYNKRVPVEIIRYDDRSSLEPV